MIIQPAETISVILGVLTVPEQRDWHQPRLWSHADNAKAVISGGDNAADMGAMGNRVCQRGINILPCQLLIFSGSRLNYVRPRLSDALRDGPRIIVTFNHISAYGIPVSISVESWAQIRMSIVNFTVDHRDRYALAPREAMAT